jgi:hypothetical protein
MADLTRCTVCNRRAELNEYGECPTCQNSIEDCLEIDGLPERPSRLRENGWIDLPRRKGRVA